VFLYKHFSTTYVSLVPHYSTTEKHLGVFMHGWYNIHVMANAMRTNQTRLYMSEEIVAAQQHYANVQARKLAHNMARGNPSKEQLALSDHVARIDFPNEIDGVDVRTYSTADYVGGLPSVRHLGAKMLGVKDENVFALGSSSLTVMSDVCIRALLHTLPGADAPWSVGEGRPRVLCGVPGYDRHFGILEDFAELVPVPILSHGPDLAIVEKELQHPRTVAMWHVPRYSNPSGVTYSKETIEGLLSIRPANTSYRDLWDDAYCLHTQRDMADSLPSIVHACAQKGMPHRVFAFASTSKMLHPGSGVAFVASSVENLAWMKSWLAKQSIGPDKVNQARLMTAFPILGALQAHMQKHRALLEPKFTSLYEGLREYLHNVPSARWNEPSGGYFVPLWLYPGTARRVHALAKDAGLTLTPAGATHPYGKNPEDNCLRLAPTYLEASALRHDVPLVLGASARLAYWELVDIQNRADA
jgi:aspartate/methionine/tyrosine aminotransferase